MLLAVVERGVGHGRLQQTMRTALNCAFLFCSHLPRDASKHRCGFSAGRAARA